MFQSNGVSYSTQKPGIQTIVCPDAETMVLCGHPVHKAAAAALPSSLSHCLQNSGQKHHGPLLWADFLGPGHRRKVERAQPKETGITVSCLFSFSLICGEVEGRGAVQRVVGKTLNSSRR